ncbi:murein transglycosylase A [Inhella gelatinilytica]|uniref:murein transglycosylase A n=1 Tax=Inhella gelatinilytica TaxID=2795030 RepID=UPI0035C1F960
MFQRNCGRPPAGWSALCARWLLDPVPSDRLQAHGWLMTHLQPYRVEGVDGQAEGLLTGYFEPELRAQRHASGRFSAPIFSLPKDPQLARAARQEFDQQWRGRTSPLLFVEDPLDALVLQIQGSGRAQVRELDGRLRSVRLAFAGHNDHPYRSVGRWLIEQGELKAHEANWPAIKAWAQANPHRVQELLWANPRLVYFREEPLADPQLGPRGAQGVPLTAGRSVAVDRSQVPYGSLLWLDSTEPLSNTPLRRLVLAQDTGAAIQGAVRADYFWGWGPEAEQQAGRMKQALRYWVLWPRDATMPASLACRSDPCR